ncbi:Putative cytochrome P450 E-class, group I [Podospora comata]|uniref:Cytochrome P450 E-class, group I n=1 Tax=Podospora comata TaxID=48703 RepID=A0ABY6RWM8_PODCO|nr:Putative cytochrome P450 E-class, group I [Podospora comata]
MDLFRTLPVRSISVVSLTTAYLASSGKLPIWSQWSLVSLFLALWSLQFSFWLIWVLFLYNSLFSPFQDLPTPDGKHWLFGHFPIIKKFPTGKPMIEWVNTLPNDGLIRYFGLFNQERLLPTNPKVLTELLTTKNYDFQKPSSWRWLIGRMLGIGLLLAEGDEHKVQRRNLNPAFHFRHIKNLYPIFWSKSKEGVEALTKKVLSEKKSNGPSGPKDQEVSRTAVVEVGNWASRIALDIIGVTGLGRDFGAILDPGNELNQIYQNLFSPSKQSQTLGMLNLIFPARLVQLLPVQRNADILEAARYIRNVCHDLIRAKKEKQERKESLGDDILSTAIESGAFSDDNLVDQLMTFLAAGHETTASAMTWAIYLLSKNPEIQSRLRAEVRSRLPSLADDSSQEITSVDIDSMTYLNAVCSEVLRYFPPAPVTIRVAACDTSIQGRHIPKGTQFMIIPWAINKSEALWGPDAREFKPDRWVPKDETDKSAASGGATSNYAFLTFLHGPRSCIGQQFAKAEFACMLATWVGRFEMELENKEEEDEEKISIKSTLTARPEKGLFVRLKVLDGW